MEYSPYVLTPLLISAFVFLGLTLFLFRNRKAPAAHLFGLITVCAAGWSLGQGFSLAGIALETKVFWLNVKMSSVAFIPALWFLLAVQYTQQSHHLNRWRTALLFGIPLITIGMIWTSGYHNLYRYDFRLVQLPLFSVLEYKNGVWAWIYEIFSYGAEAGSLLMLIRFVRQSPALYAKPVTWLIVCVLFPTVFDILYIMNASPVPGYNLSPNIFIVTGPLMAWILFRYHTLDIIPIARKTVVDNLTDPIIIIDKYDRLVDFNHAAADAFSSININHIGSDLKTIFLDHPRLFQSILNDRQGEEICLGEEECRKWYDLSMTPILDKLNRIEGKIIHLRDISIRKQMQSELEAANTRLESQVRERTLRLEETINRLEIEVSERQNLVAALRRTEASLSQRVADQSRKIAAVYEVILIGGQTIDIKDLMARTLEKIILAMNGDAGCIHLANEDEGGILKLTASQGVECGGSDSSRTLPLDWIPAEGIPLIVPDLQHDVRLPEPLKGAGYGSYIGARVALQGRILGVLSIFWKEQLHLQVDDIALFSAMADQLGLLIENVDLRLQIEQAAVQRERRRLARDLHDSVTQSLHSLVLAADTAGNRFRQGKLDRVDNSLEHLSESARQALKEMRLLLYELRLASPTQVDFLDALRLRLDSVENRAGVKGSLIVEGHISLPGGWDDELFWITMEALNNSLKYAFASEVTVRLIGGDECVVLEVSDNGKGFDSLSISPGGMGLVNMRERVDRMGGRLEIESLPGKGTTIRVILRLEVSNDRFN